MKLATFHHRGRSRAGLVFGEEIADLSALAPELPQSVIGLLQAGSDALASAARAASAGGSRIPLREVQLRAPIERPGKLLAIGLNYADHVAETGKERPRYPTVFNKQTTCVNGPFDPIHRPRASEALDYEGELALVIGRRCRHVPKQRAAEVIAGYCVAHDVTVRDFQLHTATMTMGKSFDTHGPFGPYLTTADEVPDPHALEIKTWVNGELRQHSNTSNLIFSCYDLIAYLSSVCTLEPGDVISTGTPSGVGVARKPPAWLRAGDVVRIEIERLGAIENAVIEEPADTVQL